MFLKKQGLKTKLESDLCNNSKIDMNKNDGSDGNRYDGSRKDLRIKAKS